MEKAIWIQVEILFLDSSLTMSPQCYLWSIKGYRIQNHTSLSAYNMVRRWEYGNP